MIGGEGWLNELGLLDLSPIQRGFAPSFVNCKKGCTRLAAASNKVYQLLAQGRWFSPGTPASSTTKTGRHDHFVRESKSLLPIFIYLNKTRRLGKWTFFMYVQIKSEPISDILYISACCPYCQLNSFCI
jgi:hypothetical protein